MITADAHKRQSEVEAAKQRLDKAIARATESFALLLTRLVPVMCPRPCAECAGQKQEPEAVRRARRHFDIVVKSFTLSNNPEDL